MTASPFRLYHAQISDGIFLGMMTPSSVVSSTLDAYRRLPLAEKRIPCVTQKDGKMQKTHLRGSPTFIVIGMYCSTYTRMTRRPPEVKCKNSVTIYALISDLKMKDVT